jgi:hypothetical protein
MASQSGNAGELEAMPRMNLPLRTDRKTVPLMTADWYGFRYAWRRI